MPINKEILVYHSIPFKKYRWISYFSIIQVGFLGINFLVLPTPRLIREREEALRNKIRKKERKVENTEQSSELFEEYEPNPNYDSATLFQRIKRLDYRQLFTFRNIYENATERPLVTCGLLGASALVTGAFWFYAYRMVHRIVLLPNERVRFSFFSPFAIGEPPTLEIPLRNVSCLTDRKSQNNYSILKLKGYVGHHLVHKTEGQFLEPKLYDKYLGFARSWLVKS